MTASTITRYRQRPPEVDALLVTAATVDGAVSWLAAWGLDAYRVAGALRVVPGEPHPAWEVPFGHHLVHSVAHAGRWAAVPPGQLVAEYEPLTTPVRRPEPFDLRRIGDVDPPTDPPRRLGQPGRGL